MRWWTWSPYSHVGLVDRHEVVESKPEHGGVRAVPLREFLLRPRTESRLIAHPDPDAVIAAARSQIGKPYDFGFIAGIAMRRDLQRPDAWSCSELIAWACEHSGKSLFPGESSRRVTQHHLYMISEAMCHDPNPNPCRNYC